MRGKTTRAQPDNTKCLNVTPETKRKTATNPLIPNQKIHPIRLVFLVPTLIA